MKIKKVITSGCSFSDPDGGWTWPCLLEKHVLLENPNVKFTHKGMGSQGNELIQKKITIELTESLKKFHADEIAVIVMWSANTRKSFFINDFDNLLKQRRPYKKPNEYPFVDSFRDLNNYQAKNMGWLVCQLGIDGSNLTNEYYYSVPPVGQIHTSLENIIFLQNFCKLLGVTLYQQFFTDQVYKEFISYKEDLNVNYLYSMLDHATIVRTHGMDGFLKNMSENMFADDMLHPNYKGHELWVDDVLIPFLKQKEFFK